MHLGFLTSEYPHPRINRAAGIGTSIKNMVEALTGADVQVSIFVYDQKEDAIFTERGIKFHLIKKRKFKIVGWYLYRKTLQNYINKYITVDRIDAVEAADWTGITAFMKLKCPLVIRFHGTDAYFCHLEGRKQKRKNFWFEKTALQGADHLLSVSEFTAQETAKIFNLKKPVKIIPNSVDVKKFVPQKKEFVSNRLLYFGTIIRKKGVLELTEIFNEIHQRNPKVELFIAGKDVMDNKTGSSTKQLMLEMLTIEAAKNVKWLDVLPYEDVMEQIAMAKVVILPSFAEALPMTWLEAMAMKKALVTSNIGWAKEVMVNGKTGFTEDPKNTSAFSEKVLKLLETPDLAEEMGKAAREQVMESFSTEVVTKKNIKFYKEITGN